MTYISDIAPQTYVPSSRPAAPVTRGYAAIGLTMPKKEVNVGGALRAAACYGADLIAISGRRYEHTSSDTLKAWKHIPMFEGLIDVFDGCPYGAVPVAIDLVDDAVPLPEFRHPERAFYIFGPEDGTLGDRILSRCKHRVMVPTSYCMNLAATVNVVLYDRLVKRGGRAS